MFHRGAWFFFLPLLGCGGPYRGATESEPSSAPGTAMVSPAPVTRLSDLFKDMPQGADSFSALCAGNTGTDKFTSVFCGADAPKISSLDSLHSALGLTDTAKAACTTASGSLYKMETSVLTPRCFRFSAAGTDPNAVTVAYLRSDKTFAEVAALDPVSTNFRFFLVKFDLPCEATGSCKAADYMTMSAESNWQNVSVYEDHVLKNTPVDCTACHQSNGTSAAKTLRMIETQSPWEHWFHNNRPCGQALLADFMGAHGNEARYAGLTPTEMNDSDPGKMQQFVSYNGSLGFQFGNDIYNSDQILYEVSATPGQPSSNATPGVSATWQDLYAKKADGIYLQAFGASSIPYHDCKQSDPHQLPAFTSNFLGVLAGTVSKEASLNLSDVNLSTPQALADRSLTPAIGLTTARQILSHACLSCHNSNLDQNIGRAMFNAQELSLNTPSIYSLALGRIERAATDVYRMPPPTHMNLNSGEIKIVSDFFISQGAQ